MASPWPSALLTGNKKGASNERKSLSVVVGFGARSVSDDGASLTAAAPAGRILSKVVFFKPAITPNIFIQSITHGILPSAKPALR